jgi:pyruvate-formate lyase-activating enzyme
MEVIRKTLSTCPHCHKKINAYLIERDGKILMQKECLEHDNVLLLISKHPWYYKGLTEYYFEVMPKKMVQRRFYIYLSNKCNLNCPICLLEPNQDKLPDISLFQFEQIIKKNKSSRFYLYGAEPTLRSDLSQWIKLLKRHGNLVNMHTNGIKLVDYEYLKTLKDCGLDYVSIQFDGFNDKAYNILRGQSLLDKKLNALENLRRLNISTGLNVTIAKGINEDQIKPILDYAANNSFIKDVSFASLSFIGSANKNFSSDLLLMPDDIIDMVEKQSESKISRNSIFLFQKLYYALLSAFNMRRCYNFQQMALLRDEKNGYITFASFFKLGRLEKDLNKYKDLVKKNRRLAVVYLFYKLAVNFISGNFFTKLKSIPVNILFPGRILHMKIPSRLLLLSFGTVCDFYKYDSQIAQYCGQGFCFEGKHNNIILTDSISDLSLFYQETFCNK